MPIDIFRFEAEISKTSNVFIPSQIARTVIGSNTYSQVQEKLQRHPQTVPPPPIPPSFLPSYIPPPSVVINEIEKSYNSEPTPVVLSSAPKLYTNRPTVGIMPQKIELPVMHSAVSILNIFCN